MNVTCFAWILVKAITPSLDTPYAVGGHPLSPSVSVLHPITKSCNSDINSSSVSSGFENFFFKSLHTISNLPMPDATLTILAPLCKYENNAWNKFNTPINLISKFLNI